MALSKKAFEVGDFEVASIVTDKYVYEYGYDDILAEVRLWSKEFSGEFSLYLADKLFYCASLVFDGYTVVSFEVPKEEMMELGFHNLRAELVKEGLTSFKIRDFEVADTIPPEIIIVGIKNGNYYNYPVIPEVEIFDFNFEASLTLLNGNKFISGSTVSEEAEYQLYVSAWDTSKNIAQKDIYFVIDQTPPILTLPFDDDSYFNYTFTFSAGIVEPHRDLSQENVNVVFNDETIATASINEALILENEGTYQINVQAIDLAGNHSQLNRTLTLDFTPPVIEIVGVENESYYNHDLTIQANIIELYRESANEVLIINYQTYPFNTEIILTQEDDYLLLASAIDKAGNPAKIIFLSFKTPPIIKIEGFTSGRYYNQDVEIFATVIDNNRDYESEVLIIDGAIASFDSYYVVSREGEHTVSARVQDLASNTAN